jgi:hypothetical protein
MILEAKAKELIFIISKEAGPKVEPLKQCELSSVKRRVLGDLFLFKVD